MLMPVAVVRLILLIMMAMMTRLILVHVHHLGRYFSLGGLHRLHIVAGTDAIVHADERLRQGSAQGENEQDIRLHIVQVLEMPEILKKDYLLSGASSERPSKYQLWMS